MDQSSSGRSRQPPRAGPSLASPVPSSLRPSAFRPRASFAPTSPLASPGAQTPSTAQPPPLPAPHPTPATFRRPNPFNVLPSASFDSFVDDITARIRSALAGPPKPERRVALEHSPRVTSGDEDVFGEVKALADAAPTANGTLGHPEHQHQHQHECSEDESESGSGSELDRPALASGDDDESGAESDGQVSAASAQQPELDSRRAPLAMPVYGSDSSSDADGDGDGGASDFVADVEMEYLDDEDELELAPLSYEEQIAAFGWDEPVASERPQNDYKNVHGPSAPPSPSPPPPAAIEVLELGSDSDDDDLQPEPFAANASDGDVDVEDASVDEFGDDWFDDGEREGEVGETDTDLPFEYRPDSPPRDESPMRVADALEYDDEAEGDADEEGDAERRTLHAPSRSASPDDALAVDAPPVAESDAESILGSRIPWAEKGKDRALPAPTPPSLSTESSSSETDSQYESDLDLDMELSRVGIANLSRGRLAAMLDEIDQTRGRAIAEGRRDRVLQLERDFSLVQAIYEARYETEGSEAGETEDGSREDNGSGDDDAFSETDEDRTARLEAEERISEIAQHLVSMESRGEHRPLEIANHVEHQPPPPPPAAAEDHITFEVSDDDEESSEAQDSDRAALLGLASSGTGPSVFGAPPSPEPDEPEVVVLTSDDDGEDADEDEEGAQRSKSQQESSSDDMAVDEDARLRIESSEPISYASSDRADDSDSGAQSYEPATIKNVLAPGYWDPSTPLRFGPPAAMPEYLTAAEYLEVEPAELSADNPRELELDVEMSLEVDAEDATALSKSASYSSTLEAAAQPGIFEPEAIVRQDAPSLETESLLSLVDSAPTPATRLESAEPEARDELEVFPPLIGIDSPAAESFTLPDAPADGATAPSENAPAPLAIALPSPSASPVPDRLGFEYLDGASSQDLFDSFFNVDPPPPPSLEASDDLAALVRTLQDYVEPAFIPFTDSLEASSEALERPASPTLPYSSEYQPDAALGDPVSDSTTELDEHQSDAVVDTLEREQHAGPPRLEPDANLAPERDVPGQEIDVPAQEMEEPLPEVEYTLPSGAAHDEPTPSDFAIASPPTLALVGDRIDGEAVPEEDRTNLQMSESTLVETELAQVDMATDVEADDSDGDTTAQSDDLVITAVSPHFDEMEVENANSGSEPTAAGDELASPIDAPPSPPSPLAAQPESEGPMSATDVESFVPEEVEPLVASHVAMDLNVLSVFTSTASGQNTLEPSRDVPPAEPLAPEFEQKSREATPTVDEPTPAPPTVVVEPFSELAEPAVEPEPNNSNSGRGHRRSRSDQSFSDEEGSEDELTLVPTASRKPSRRRKVALDSSASDPTRRHSPRLSIGQPEATSPRRRTRVPLPSELSQSFIPAEPLFPDEEDTGSQAQAPEDRAARSVSEASSSGGTGRKRPQASVAPASAPADEPEPLLKAEASQPAKRRRGRPSKSALAVDEGPLDASPAHQHHRRAPAVVAPVATDDRNTARSAADVGPTPEATSLHPPVTRSNCQYVVIELCSKEAPASAPYTIVLPACALAAPLAQETLDDFSGRLLGPATDCDIHDTDVVRLGGSGLEEGDADDADALIKDGDVRVAIKRILGNDLYAEGVCELVRRGPRSMGVEVISPQRKRRRD